MSMYNQYEDHSDCQEPSEFDEAIEGFKDLLYKQVAQEVQDELTALRKSNRELSEQAKELPKLVQEARTAKIEYEAAKRNAEYEASQKSINGLLSLMATPKFAVRSTWMKGPKCGKCNEDRYLPYTTPLGKEQNEPCECNVSSQHYVVQEHMAYSIGKDRYGVNVQYVPSSEYLKDPENRDYIHTKVLYKPTDVEKMVEGRSQESYGFEDRESAQELADAMNKIEENS